MSDVVTARVVTNAQLVSTSDVCLSAELWAVVVDALLALVPESDEPDHVYVALQPLQGHLPSLTSSSIVVRAIKAPSAIKNDLVSLLLSQLRR